jgi:hypothetical protein
VNATRLKTCGLNGSQKDTKGIYFLLDDTGMVRGAYGHPVAAGHRAVTRQWRVRAACITMTYCRTPKATVLPCFFLGKVLHSCCAGMRSPKKKTGCAPTHRGRDRTATQQLRSCCRGRSRPSRRYQSRTSLTRLTQQSQSTGFINPAVHSHLAGERYCFFAAGKQGGGTEKSFL